MMFAFGTQKWLINYNRKFLKNFNINIEEKITLIQLSKFVTFF